jgi:hypothetical protein
MQCTLKLHVIKNEKHQHILVISVLHLIANHNFLPHIFSFLNSFAACITCKIKREKIVQRIYEK